MGRHSIAGFLAGVFVGAVLSPVLCIALYVFIFFLGLFSLSPGSPVRPFYDSLHWLGGNPYILPVLLLCGGLGVVGYWRGPGIFFSKDLG